MVEKYVFELQDRNTGKKKEKEDERSSPGGYDRLCSTVCADGHHLFQRIYASGISDGCFIFCIGYLQ